MKNSRESILILVALALMLSGCTGAIIRGSMTDNTTYQETLQNTPSVASGMGRVFIYIPKGGPGIMNTTGLIDFISIDKIIYRFGGESYFYLDIKSGPHKVTATDVLKAAGFKNKKQYGNNRLEITAPDSGVIYLKVLAYKTKTYTLEIVPRQLAESEMMNLPFWNNSATTMTIE